MLVVSRNLLKSFGLRSLSISLWIDLFFVLLIPVLVFCAYQLQDIFRESGPMCRIYLDMLVVLQKLELYGLAGATHLAALRLDNYHSLCFTLFVSTVLFWFPTILI
ncbi:hypothetical protein VPH35_003757 [Triticum aestivum]